MKLKPHIRVRPGKISAGTMPVDDRPRADMYLPAWMFVLGAFFVMFGVILGTVLSILQISVLLVVLAILVVVWGMAMLMWWKNQTIRILSEETFEYCTFLGKKTLYRFDAIRGIKKGSDSTTVFVGEGKVHIESVAIVSECLAERINAQLPEGERMLP